MVTGSIDERKCELECAREDSVVQRRVSINIGTVLMWFLRNKRSVRNMQSEARELYQ